MKAETCDGFTVRRSSAGLANGTIPTNVQVVAIPHATMTPDGAVEDYVTRYAGICGPRSVGGA